jgi:hypothetical protein
MNPDWSYASWESPKVRGGGHAMSGKVVTVDKPVHARKLRAMELVNQMPGAPQVAS